MEQQQGSPLSLIIMVIFFVFIFFIPALKISKKAGFDWKMAVCLTIPGFNVVAWLALAFMDWPIHKRLPKDMNGIMSKTKES
ncbi:hypothetical protein EHU51_12095 [Escherichia coli]|uniref:hypothetical protein n=1 Tax=Escherichia coli TaxID=562 RepID=UPI000B7D0B3E|nr:hypothetical protein [Escherichia coli]EBW4157487.1 hypothetical protein [Salmonella enterica subsp. enterica serovar Adelaide]ECW2402059.1 hypothetical protein [Salmonella enterica]EDV9341604.1 hypothetical protein [Salmonella enterica subsp. enterica]EEV8809023.1 hypothetical protein [Escherichia coli]EEX2867603.1 hypothetical protein [Escherichia coli]